jgi:predicted nucleic acid-binding protein
MRDKCLLDKNIVMDLIENRPRLDIIKPEVFGFYDEFYISSSTFLTIFYISRKLKMSKEEIFKELENFQILDVTKNHCIDGYNMSVHADDVEDCVEIAIAKENNLVFVTADLELTEKYKRKCRMKLIVS